MTEIDERSLADDIHSIAKSLSSIAKSLNALDDITEAIGPAQGQSVASLVDQLQILNNIQANRQ